MSPSSSQTADARYNQNSNILKTADAYMKNCDPFVSLPLLAIDSRYSLLCLTAKLSSGEKGQDCTAILNIRSVWENDLTGRGGQMVFTFKEASIDRFASSPIACNVNGQKIKARQGSADDGYCNRFLVGPKVRNEQQQMSLYFIQQVR